ncbi:MAG: hypothetical protein CVV49_13295 [Spirochaetae bacterium HGW-Spirochaetae-5]|nr:MAG: hypothetical protein CVV49_13295 [Spirochaetae bacterium HGW-Spirochaetae-5]
MLKQSFSLIFANDRGAGAEEFKRVYDCLCKIWVDAPFGEYREPHRVCENALRRTLGAAEI